MEPTPKLALQQGTENGFALKNFAFLFTTLGSKIASNQGLQGKAAESEN